VDGRPLVGEAELALTACDDGLPGRTQEDADDGLSGSYNQNLWIDHLIWDATYLPH
jgi:hypothetical protein